MDDLTKYKELVRLLEQMINDKVNLIQGGHVIEWSDTKIPQIIMEIKKDFTNNDKYTIFPSNDN